MTFDEFLKENDYEESTFRGWASLVSRKDGKDIYIDENGNGFKALSNELLWELACKSTREELMGVDLLKEQSKEGENKTILTHEDLHKIIHALNAHGFTGKLLQKLNNIDYKLSSSSTISLEIN